MRICCHVLKMTVEDLDQGIAEWLVDILGGSARR